MGLRLKGTVKGQTKIILKWIYYLNLEVISIVEVKVKGGMAAILASRGKYRSTKDALPPDGFNKDPHVKEE